MVSEAGGVPRAGTVRGECATAQRRMLQAARWPADNRYPHGGRRRAMPRLVDDAPGPLTRDARNRENRSSVPWTLRCGCILAALSIAHGLLPSSLHALRGAPGARPRLLARRLDSQIMTREFKARLTFLSSLVGYDFGAHDLKDVSGVALLPFPLLSVSAGTAGGSA